MQTSGRGVIALLIAALCLVCAVTAPAQSRSDEVTFVAPFNGLDDHVILAESIHVFLERNTTLSYRYVEMPLARAHLEVPTSDNHCMLAISREPATENLFQWIVPTVTASIALFKTDVETDEQTSDTPLVWLGSNEEAFAKAMGIKTIPVKHRPTMLKMLMRGRAQYFITLDIVVDSFKRNNQILEITKLKSLVESTFWLACSPTTSPDIVEQLKAAWIKGMKSNEIPLLFSKVGLLGALPALPQS